MHSAQRSLEKSIRSDDRLSKLIDLFVLRCSTKSKNDPGSFARALAHSHKLCSKYSEAVRSQLDGVAEVLGQDFSCHFAAQRFDTITSALKKLILSLSAVIVFLTQLAALKDDKRAWAESLLAAPGTNTNQNHHIKLYLQRGGIDWILGLDALQHTASCARHGMADDGIPFRARVR